MYDSAAVCRRGHTFTAHLEKGVDIPEYCVTCGAAIITECPECDNRIRGSATNIQGGYSPPDFCDHCGVPFPWITREGCLYQLQNLLDKTDLDPATRLKVREELEALSQTALSEEEERQHWQQVKTLAPALWDAGQKILVNVVSEAIKKSLGL
jgi:hypothetical protein